MRMIILLLSVLVAPTAWGWGCTGHQVVAMLAYSELTPRARFEADQRLADLSQYASLSHYCPQLALSKFAVVSTWADDLRNTRPETAPWHFIDIPLSAAPADYASFCDPLTGCVVSAIRSAATALKNRELTSAQETEALVFLIHFVGDIHQPLHDATNNDRGGNCFPVAYLGAIPVEGPNETFRQNLHAIWDVQLVDALVRSHGSVKRLVAYLKQHDAARAHQSASDLNYLEWAIEGHTKAATISYGRLSFAAPVEPPTPIHSCKDDDDVGHRLEALHERIDSRYERAVSGTVEAQLALAGMRLAAILNAIWR
jgi:hypothetical protein